ncbi:hypothetical protein GCM10009555_049990 [Acrocarpospora macrocephala]|uniref:Uncharacterized protein n=1 Tax=Acrocarpospora macrocephala TaxID=150177 RepID=A0A5M3WVW6_9ACTN|nr:hypothetical protein [Acrocarpospora macrocephala]GES12880.1 hypothetical protein Amac_064770 [Acrocarpospora macrocephala]
MINKIRENGLTSQHMYIAGFASMGLSMASWLLSRAAGDVGMGRADHWGIFIGQWAPTFFTLGIALRIEESMDGKHDMMGKSKTDMDSRMARNARMGSPA